MATSALGAISLDEIKRSIDQLDMDFRIPLVPAGTLKMFD